MLVDNETILKIKTKIAFLESKLDNNSNDVKRVKEDMKEFIDNVNKSNESFKRWLIGVILGTLILGLFGQFAAFSSLQKDINRVEKIIIEIGKK